MSKVAANLTSKSATLPESTPARFPTDDLMFVKLEKILIECIDKKNDDQYIPMAQQVKQQHLFTISCIHCLVRHFFCSEGHIVLCSEEHFFIFFLYFFFFLFFPLTG